MDNQNVLHPNNGVLFSHHCQTNDVPWPAAMCRNLENFMLSEVSQTPKGKYCMILLV